VCHGSNHSDHVILDVLHLKRHAQNNLDKEYFWRVVSSAISGRHTKSPWQNKTSKQCLSVQKGRGRRKVILSYRSEILLGKKPSFLFKHCDFIVVLSQ